jgi:hypothetical protein
LFGAGGDKGLDPRPFSPVNIAGSLNGGELTMENRLFTSYQAWMTLTGLILGTTAAFAAVPSISVDTAAEVAALNGTSATYGPPSNATFPDGPLTVGSGTSATLTGGPNAANADTILLVLSATSTDVTSLGAGTITLGFDSATGSPVTFHSSDFFTTTAGGFPSSIMGIANGAVNGIMFPTAEHAAADITFPTTLTNGVALGDVTITSPINLRVDVFGDKNGKIVGNAANTGAEGVTPIPEPSSMALYGVGAVGLMGVMMVRHRRHHCTSA